MIRRDSEQSNEIPVTVRRRPARLGDAQGVEYLKDTKVWLHDSSVARSIGFTAQDLGKIQRMVKSHKSSLMEAWNAFFGT